MNISRNEVNEFHYSSSVPAGKQTIIVFGTANTNDGYVKMTDLKLSCSTATNVSFFVSSSDNQPFTMKLGASACVGFSWELPYSFPVAGTSGETRRFVASADGTGVKFSVSGYVEK